jgi:aspartyl-tRNA(Asn)/glutamyl-tRNA(Gln) amidotransferase subunit A
VPLGVKDLEDAAGLATTHGSRPLRDKVADRDSTQVARLRAAGAIVFGKTNTPEYGSGAVTKNLLFGATSSPWDKQRTPGGSSGGSAAALAGELLPLVTASDGGGSIRIPGSFVGAIGLKPSFGRVPRGPFTHWDHGSTIVYGPISKTVADAALFLDLTAGYASTDAASLPAPAVSYRELLALPLARRLRIGYSPDLGHGVVQSDIAAVVEDGVRALEKLGHTIVPVKSAAPDVAREWSLLTAFEIATIHGELADTHEAELGRGVLEMWRGSDPMRQRSWAKIAAKRAELLAWCGALFADCDVLVTPTVPFDPPPARGPLPRETEGRPQPHGNVATFTIPFNMSWHPALTMRAGLSRAGLPVGLQLVAAHHREDLLLQLGSELERVLPAHPFWPLRA